MACLISGWNSSIVVVTGALGKIKLSAFFQLDAIFLCWWSNRLKMWNPLFGHNLYLIRSYWDCDLCYKTDMSSFMYSQAKQQGKYIIRQKQKKKMHIDNLYMYLKFLIFCNLFHLQGATDWKTSSLCTWRVTRVKQAWDLVWWGGFLNLRRAALYWHRRSFSSFLLIHPHCFGVSIDSIEFLEELDGSKHKKTFEKLTRNF